MRYMEEELKKGATLGLLDAGKDFAKDIFNFVMDPGAAEMAVYESVIHYKQTYKIMAKAIHDSYEKNMVHGDWYSRSHWVTYVIGSAFANVAGTKGMGAAAKTGMATARVATKTVVSKAGKLAQIPSKTPLEYSLAVDGQVPYNAVNSKGLKDRLSAFSDEGRVGKGTGNTSKAVDDVVKEGSHFLDEFNLKPNVKYEKNGYLYQTDEQGRIERASGELTLEMGERNSKHQLAAGGEDRVKAPSNQGNHGGHLIGTQFNGSPLIDNIVAMNGNVNVSAYKKLESAWAKALRDKREVIVDIRPVYEGNSVRPVSFNIKYRIDGEKFKASLKNVSGGK